MKTLQLNLEALGLLYLVTVLLSIVYCTVSSVATRPQYNSPSIPILCCTTECYVGALMRVCWRVYYHWCAREKMERARSLVIGT